MSLYRKDYPFLLMPLAGQPPLYVIQQLLLVKAEAWKHEDEYRLIDVPNLDTGVRMLDSVAQRLAPQLFRFNPSQIVGVTCGANMEGAELERVMRICSERTPRLPMFQARILKHSFSLTFESVRG